MGGYGRGIRGQGRRFPGGKGLGPGGRCVCPRCGHTASHALGQPCYELTCPKCGVAMTR